MVPLHFDGQDETVTLRGLRASATETDVTVAAALARGD